MATITIRLLASYRHYLPAGHTQDGTYALDAPAGMSAGEALARLPIPPGDAYTFLVNGRHAERDQALAEGDELAVFPAVGGG